MPEIILIDQKKVFISITKMVKTGFKNWANEHIYENNYEFINKEKYYKKWEEHKSGKKLALSNLDLPNVFFLV